MEASSSHVSGRSDNKWHHREGPLIHWRCSCRRRCRRRRHCRQGSFPLPGNVPETFRKCPGEQSGAAAATFAQNGSMQSVGSNNRAFIDTGPIVDSNTKLCPAARLPHLAQPRRQFKLRRLFAPAPPGSSRTGPAGPATAPPGRASSSHRFRSPSWRAGSPCPWARPWG